MSEPSTKIVPFGKYKGQPVEAMVQDREYVEWLTAQPWFREKFQPIYNVVINNFGEPSETPEHNALQALFLEHDYRVAFLVAAGGDLVGALQALTQNVDDTGKWLTSRLTEYSARAAEAYKQAEVENQKRLAWDAAVRAADPSDLVGDFDVRLGIGRQPSQSDIDYHRQRGAEFAERADPMRKAAEVCAAFLDSPGFRLTSGVTFERDAIDVSLSVTMWAKLSIDGGLRVAGQWGNYDPVPDGAFRFSERWDLSVEIKPAVGDDYPAILRQMRRNGCPYMFTDRYTGTGATLDQVRKIFATAGKHIVLKADADAALAKVQQTWKPVRSEE